MKYRSPIGTYNAWANASIYSCTQSLFQLWNAVLPFFLVSRRQSWLSGLSWPIQVITPCIQSFQTTGPIIFHLGSPYPTRTKFDLRWRFLLASLALDSGVNEVDDIDETNRDSEASDDTGIWISVGTCNSDGGIVATIVGLDESFICLVIFCIPSKSSS